jgi:FHA domain
MKQFFEKARRLFEPRTQTPAETVAQPTADRPPPLRTEPLPEEATTIPDAVPTADAVSEVRLLLEAVAEAPVSAPESEADTPLADPAPAPTLPPASNDESVAIPTAPPDRVGDALVLTLATPAATFAVAKASATIGRGQENTIRLDDLSVSRRHARIAYRQGGYWLSDLGSMGGTWVNGTRLNAPRRIAAGEVIDIGLCRLTVSSVGGAAKADTKKNASTPRSELAESRRPR